MSGALIVSAVVTDGDVVIPAGQHYTERKKRKAKQWGDGTPLTIRIEPEEEAANHGHHKHLHGHLLAPVSGFTGYTVTELKADMKARFLPEGMKSTTEMNREQFEEFNRSVEQCIREEYPAEAWEACAAAMALSEYRS